MIDIQLRLLVITPFRNEEKSLKAFMDSIVRQSYKPVAWFMVDDNSDDGSAKIIDSYSEDFIKYVKLPYKREGRATGGNVVNVFNYALEQADEKGIGWDIVLKLDADLVIDNKDYFEFIIAKFEQYPQLGISSGVTYILQDGAKKIESNHKWHSQGQTKFYRKECLEQIGGLKPFKGWDGLDDILAREKGFITEKFFEQTVHHLYPTQTRSSEGGVKKGLEREAQGYFNMGYPSYMYLLKSFKILKSSGLSNSIFFIYKCLQNKFSKQPPLSKEERKIVRKFMVQRFLGKFNYIN
jgi:glycosyltransferase involved in cell wall biosynthesis